MGARLRILAGAILARSGGTVGSRGGGWLPETRIVAFPCSTSTHFTLTRSGLGMAREGGCARMTVMLSKTYEALKAAGAPDGIAREASEEIAGFESRVSGIEFDMKLLKWMTGTNVALTAAVLFRLLTA